MTSLHAVGTQGSEVDRNASAQNTSDSFVGVSKAAQGIRNFIVQAANSTAPVLLLGQTGSGKDHVARRIHDLGNPDAPDKFVEVHLATLTPDLLAAELFGHTATAFTGANSHKYGLLHDANGGTLYLNEMQGVPGIAQAHFMRLLDPNPTYRMVGSNKSEPFRARVIAASNADLRTLIRRGEFREDLFYRLNVLRCYVPPLRDRFEDLPELVRDWAVRREGNQVRAARLLARFSSEALEALTRHHWPGNVRELHAVLTRVVVQSSRDEMFRAEDVLREIDAADVQELNSVVPYGSSTTSFNAEVPSFAAMSDLATGTSVGSWAFPYGEDGRFITLREGRRRHLFAALLATNGKKAAAARLLGTSLTSLKRWLNELDVNLVTDGSEEG